MPTSYDSKSAIELFRNEKEYTWCEENLQGFFLQKQWSPDAQLI